MTNDKVNYVTDPELTCYKIYPNPPQIIGARGRRPWMDATDKHYAYRCTPMTMANESGWEVLSPCDFSATWTGRKATNALTIESSENDAAIKRLVSSHFGYGILTFHLGWLLKTSPGWGIWARGVPNLYKEGIVPLEGLVETEWLPFGFTMNWRFVRTGTINFRRGEPFCFFTLAPHAYLEDIVPQEFNLSDDETLMQAHAAWKESRHNFNVALGSDNPQAVQQGWEKKYLKGPEDGTFHRIKRRLMPPQASIPRAKVDGKP